MSLIEVEYANSGRKDQLVARPASPNTNQKTPFIKPELKTIMDIAIEYRKRVNDWLHILAPGEFPKKELNYTLK